MLKKIANKIFDLFVVNGLLPSIICLALLEETITNEYLSSTFFNKSTIDGLIIELFMN